MDKKSFLKILNFIDSYFYESNNVYDSDGFYGLFNETIFALEYLDVDDFVSFHTGELNYIQYRPLEKQYDEINHLLRCKIMVVVFNIIYYSNIEIKIKEKIAGFLARYKILFTDETGYRKMILKQINRVHHPQ